MGLFDSMKKIHSMKSLMVLEFKEGIVLPDIGTSIIYEGSPLTVTDKDEDKNTITVMVETKNVKPNELGIINDFKNKFKDAFDQMASVLYVWKAKEDDSLLSLILWDDLKEELKSEYITMSKVLFDIAYSYGLTKFKSDDV